MSKRKQEVYVTVKLTRGEERWDEDSRKEVGELVHQIKALLERRYLHGFGLADMNIEISENYERNAETVTHFNIKGADLIAAIERGRNGGTETK